MKHLNAQTSLNPYTVTDTEGAVKNVRINRVSVLNRLNLEKMEGLSLPIVMSLGVHLGALLFGCVVSFGVCNLCLNTYRRNRKTEFDCITEVENQNLIQVHP